MHASTDDSRQDDGQPASDQCLPALTLRSFALEHTQPLHLSMQARDMHRLLQQHAYCPFHGCAEPTLAK